MTVAALEQEPYFKQQFATFVAQGFTPYLAALKIWTADHERGYAYQIAESWKDDPYVQDVIAGLKAKNAKADAPLSKEDFLKQITAAIPGMADEDKIKAWRLQAEVSGFIVKAADTTTINKTKISNRVLVVRDLGDDMTWEDRARSQQAKLITDSAR